MPNALGTQVVRQPRQSWRGVCTELLYNASRQAYGEYVEHLECWCGANSVKRDSFGPAEARALYLDEPDLYERIR